MVDSDTLIYIVGGACLVGMLISACLAHWRGQRRTKRMLLMDLFKGYFRGNVPADQLGQRTRKIASRHFIGSPEFYSLAIAAFQSAVDAKLAHGPHPQDDEKKLLSLLAVLKNEFGLTDRYQIEGWRAGRE
jgi:hypothetical protein